MTKDLVYVFDKITFESSELGEIQSGFNMSFVIDGTKDSAKIIVWSWSSVEIEPYTILWHKNTDTWWVVSSDKVERYKNEDGNLYIHNLELVGAIELLNARDLTDCGFNDNTYTVHQFISRLFSLSNFEYIVDYSNIDSNFKSKNVSFIKTFENYTLLSALREFLDAYNMCPKLSFGYTIYQGKYRITDAILNITPKTGDYSLASHLSENFYDAKEIKTMNKESFGTCVVSNAENVISSKDKTFPNVGCVRNSADEYTITASNANIRLPSKVYKANWLKLVTSKAPLRLTVHYNGKDVVEQEPISCMAYDISSTNNAFETIRNLVLTYTSQSFYDDFNAAFSTQLENIVDKLKKASSVTLYNGNQLNPVTGEIVKGDKVPYLVYANYYSKNIFGTEYRALIFCDKETKNNLKRKWQGIAWERGSNLITGFDGFDPVTGSRATIIFNIKYTDLGVESNQYIYFNYDNGHDESVTLATLYNPTGSTVEMHLGPTDISTEGELYFIVNYIPMSDLKIKVDNQRDKKDIQLYNQNGKLTDNVALSKLINSYSKEISSDTITKYRQDHSYSSCPKVGSIVYIDNDPYVINNVSLDFSLNEAIGEMEYFINGEYTMCKYISTKSLMVNPNTNIRDYGIPQNYNVKRKQLYRDYYELSYNQFDDANIESPYYDFTNIFTFPNETAEIADLVSVMKLTFDEPFGGDGDTIDASDTWFYQLDATKYYLDKMVYIIVDFNDNNIIGYGSQNVFSGFVVSRIFSGLTDRLNTPISYVDGNGKVKSFDLLLCSNSQIMNIYRDYQDDNNGSTYEGSLYNYSVFIPEDIYTAALDNHEIRITEEYYNKDALEVPVFEYVCQIDDSDDVLVGDNILTQHHNCLYFYSATIGGENDNFNQNNVINANELIATQSSPLGWRINNGVTLGNANLGAKLLSIRLYDYMFYDINDMEFDYGNSKNITSGRDIAIFRTSLDKTTGQVVADELLFIFKKVPTNKISGNLMTVFINNYKLR